MSSSELIESCSANSCGLTAGSSGGVSGLNMISLPQTKALEFTSVNGSPVISSGCGCSPRTDSSAASHKCDCIAGVNVENHIPGQQVTPEGVHYENTFVGNHEFGSNKDQMSGEREENGPEASCGCASKVAHHPGLNSHDATNQDNHCCVGVPASRAEGLSISHMPIIAGVK
jgi:hypothetical protein